MKFKVYYRIFGGVDAHITYGSLKTMQLDMLHQKKLDFEYLNACVVNEDGSEEIAYTGFDEIMAAR